MNMKYQMTERGMQSLYSLAWRHGAAPGSAFQEDPIFGRHDAEEELAESEDLLLAEVVLTPGRLAPLEDAVRQASERERRLARREVDLLWLGYTGV